MFKIQGWVEQGNTKISTGGLTSSNVAQGSFPSSLVTVYIHGSVVLAGLFSDDNSTPTPMANPFTSNADGTFGFYAISGRYDLVFSGGNLPAPYTISDVTNGAGGGSGNVVGPISSIDGDFAVFRGTTGQIIADSGYSPLSFVGKTGTPIPSHIAVFDSGASNLIRDGGTGITALVSGPSSATDGNLAVFQGGSGKIVKDGGPASSAGLTLIAENLLAVDTASVTFSAIPGTYRHLMIMIQARGTEATANQYVFVQLNGDNASNYDDEFSEFANASTTFVGRAGQTSARLGDIPCANSSNAAQAGVLEMFIPNYAGTTFWKSIRSSGYLCVAASTTNNPIVGNWGANWRSTAAITSITFTPNANNFKAGSLFSLYGLK